MNRIKKLTIIILVALGLLTQLHAPELSLALNPQPEPPGLALNPQPEPPGLSLNPQPEPPG
jgi:hypothetical protein